MTDFELEEGDARDIPPRKSPGKADVLSFRSVNRVLDASNLPLALENEFALMRSMLTKEPTEADFGRIGMGSGSHFLKLTTPRAEGSQSVLRFPRARRNTPSTYAPSLNAPDIPVAKVVYRPLDIAGRSPKSVIDYLRDPDDLTDTVMAAFVTVFGAECLDGLRRALLGEGQQITRLPAVGEFPVIFLPRPGGGDIQATPVSPVENFMGFKDMAAAWFIKQEKDMPPPPRGRWIRQAVSAKPQNISGAIGGPRQRFLAEMPPVMRSYESAIRRYALGGRFPAWYDDRVEAAVLQYEQRLDMEYTNKAIREGTDQRADGLISGALEFIASVRADARDVLAQEGREDSTLPEPPRPSALILNRRWSKRDKEKAMRAMTSPHFRDRERIALEREGA